MALYRMYSNMLYFVILYVFSNTIHINNITSRSILYQIKIIISFQRTNYVYVYVAPPIYRMPLYSRESVVRCTMVEVLSSRVCPSIRPRLRLRLRTTTIHRSVRIWELPFASV